MNIARLYTGSDGRTHIEAMSLDTHRELATAQNADSIVFRAWDPRTYWSSHPAPRRRFVITLSGEVEFGVADGTMHRCRRGDAILAEDLTGTGHTTRVVSRQPWCVAAIELE
jgi:hypothetical protein